MMFKARVEEDIGPLAVERVGLGVDGIRLFGQKLENLLLEVLGAHIVVVAFD